MIDLYFIAFILFPIIGNMFLIYTLFDFMRRVDRNIYRKKVYYFIAFILFFLISTLISFRGNIVANILSLVAGILLIGHFLFNNSKIYLIYYFIFSVSFLLFDIIAQNAFLIITSLLKISFKDMYYDQIFAVIVVRFIEYIFVKIFTRSINRKKVEKVTLSQFIGFLIIPTISIIYIYTLVMYLQLYSGFFEVVLFIINIILTIGLNIYTTYIFETISKNNVLQNEINLFHQQTDLQYKYYDNLEKKYEESRKIIHDIRNHLHTVENLYSTGDKESGKKYTDDIHRMLNELNQKYYTRNRVLNIILNDKFNKIKNTHIDLNYSTGDVGLEFIRDIDITTIFANLLDNAIEAAYEVKDNSYIKLDIDKFNDFIVINIINSTNIKPIKKGKLFKSTKVNHQGLGIGNIKRTLDSYEASMVIDYTENEFRVNILIPT